MDIRAIQSTDLDGIVDLLARTDAFDDEERQVARELVEDAIHRPDESGYHALVAVEPKSSGGSVLGYVLHGPTPMTEHTHDLYWIAVDATRRGQGIGRKLVAALDQTLRAEGGRIVRVEASSVADAPATLAFYHGTGFVECGRIPHFYGTDDDLVIFYRDLGA
ncbi:MAG: GNAT family N-acetyltransferase [Deltaproteobacteria bacterium]|nr:GNAT family N-acetyltransferase [Deltaproteobacteria bacterium]